MKVTAEKIEKNYTSKLKQISTQDLRDMLTILYSEPSLVINNPDFDKLDKKEKEVYAKKSAVLGIVDENRRAELLKILDKTFHIFDKEFIITPSLEEVSDGLKSIIKETEITFPKASLLIDVIKSTLNLRATGKALPDKDLIKMVECFTSDHSDKDYFVVINEDYIHPLKVSKNIKIWRMFFDLIENGSIDRNDETQDLYDYLNYNPNNKITTNTKYPRQEIIEQFDNSYKPMFKYSIQTEKALIQRQNKFKSST